MIKKNKNMEIQYIQIPRCSPLRCGKYSRLIKAASDAPSGTGVLIPRSLTKKCNLQAFYATGRDMGLKISIKTNEVNQKVLFIPNLRKQNNQS